MKRFLRPLGLAAIVMGSDASSHARNKTVELEGTPLNAKVAVAGTFTGMAGDMSTVMRDDGKNIVAKLYKEGDVSYVVDAAALIQSEIDDGDNEKVMLEGHDNNDKFFVIKSVEANVMKMYF